MTGPDSRVMRDRALAWLLLLGGIIGLIASFVLIVEKLALLADDTYIPSCNVNPVLNCGSIMRTDQAAVFGFPNPLIGVASFPVLATTGAALVSGVRLPRWFWLGLQVGVTFGMGFVAWLIFQSLYRIGALCPYCMVVWAVVIPTFWYVSLRNASAGVFGRRVADSTVSKSLREWHAAVLTGAAVVLLSLIAQRFWSYWTTLV